MDPRPGERLSGHKKRTHLPRRLMGDGFAKEDPAEAILLGLVGLGVSVPPVVGEVVGHGLIGVEPHLTHTMVACPLFSQVQQAGSDVEARATGGRSRAVAAVPASRPPAEREHLHPLPAEPYAFALGEERLADDDQTVRFGSVRYSTRPGQPHIARASGRVVGWRPQCWTDRHRCQRLAVTSSGSLTLDRSEVVQWLLSIDGITLCEGEGRGERSPSRLICVLRWVVRVGRLTVREWVICVLMRIPDPCTVTAARGYRVGGGGRRSLLGRGLAGRVW